MFSSIKNQHRLQQLTAKVFILLFGLLHINTQANEPFTVPTPQKNKGLLLLDLDIKSSSAVMTVRRLEGAASLTEIKLAPNNGRWLITELPKGNYQIVEVKVPYFDLPFRKETDKNPNWRLRIQENSLNYAGRIYVAKERTEDYIPIEKNNRLITDLPDLQNDLAPVLSTYPLVNGTGLRDDFISEFIKAGVARD